MICQNEKTETCVFALSLMKDMMKKRMIKMEKKREKKAFENFAKEMKQQKNMTKEKYTEKMEIFKKDLMKKRKEFLAKMG